VKDRVVQTAAVLVVEPIFEADLPNEQHAYRPGRGALEAVQRVRGLLVTGHTEVVDADLSGYFDSIPHVELMKSVARRIVDGPMLRLIKMWLVMPVEETDERGRTQRTTRAKDEKRGTPQGAPISPLLSNLYMRRFVLGWKLLGYEKRLDAHIVNYADDFVICCRGTAEAAHRVMQGMMERLKLTVNTAKMRTCRIPEETFDFLGYTLGRCYSAKTGRSYIAMRPSKKRIGRMCQALSEATHRGTMLTDTPDKVGELNRRLIGWANYFCLGPVSTAYRGVKWGQAPLSNVHFPPSVWTSCCAGPAARMPVAAHAGQASSRSSRARCRPQAASRGACSCAARATPPSPAVAPKAAATRPGP
jgi:group II intron reverse transcriptase/maturase